jgi:WS/DGAT/MGAT family acyltransferase
MRLNGTDAIFLTLDGPRQYEHTLKIAIVDPSAEPRAASYEWSKRLFAEHLYRVPPLRWRYAPTPLGLHFPVWVDDPDFNVDYHVRRVVCPAPGDQKALCEFISSVYAWPLDHSRPLWILWIVEGLSEGRIAYIMMVHHAYFDGAGAANALLEFTRPDKPGDAEAAARWDPKPWPSARRRILWALRDLPSVFTHDVPKALRGLRKQRALAAEYRRAGRPLPPTAASAPVTPLSRLLGHGRTFVCDALPLADFRRVGSAFGVTLNDVFLACCAATIRRFFFDIGFDADRGPILAGIPFGGDRPADKMAVGNFATADFLWLPTHVADPLERLRAASATATGVKQHLKRIQGGMNALYDALPPVVGRLIDAFIRHKQGTLGLLGNVVLSNMPGPKEPLFLDKLRIHNWFSTGQIFHGTTLNMTVWSYCQNMNLCVMGDSAMVKDGWVLWGYFREALEELVGLASAAASKSPLTSSRTTSSSAA